MLDLRTLHRALGGEVSGGHLRCPGPGHNAVDRSLSIKIDDAAPDGFLVHSFAGDDPIVCKDYVREKLGLPAFKPNGGNGRRRASDDAIERALMAAVGNADSKPKGCVVATYNYTDADGTLLFQVLRLDPKGFRQRKPDGNGGWKWELGDVRRVAYRWPELLKYPDAAVFVCEGEKDANRVASLGHCATTVAGNKWTDDCVKALAGRDVVILQDNDRPGRENAVTAAQALHGTAKSVRIVLLPDLQDKGDVSDWLDADPRRAEKLVDICFNTPTWEPGLHETKDDAEEAGKDDAEETKDGNTKTRLLPFIDMSRWDDEEPPPSEWAVRDRFPLNQVTLFTGEGATGKSILELQRAFAHTLARDWLQTLPEPGPAIFIDAGDDNSELHRRAAKIVAHYQATFSEAIKGGLYLISLAGKDAVLATASRNGKIEPTPLYNELLEAAGDIKPKAITIASSANVFAGDENVRPQVQQFIGLLTRIAALAHGGLTLVAHPSLTGINTDTGLSGTTQWHNAVRARCYLKGVKPESGEQPDGDLREIVFKKNNYGPISANLVLRWQNGLYLPVPGMNSLNRAAHEAAAVDAFIDLLHRFARSNRNVSDKPGPSYAPALFAKEDEAKRKGINSRNLAEAMRSLFKDGKIWNEPYGKPSRPHYRIAIKD